MEITATAIPDVKCITPVRHGDSRGFFAETYNKRALDEAGIDLDFVQDNFSLSAECGTLRGLHYQLPPFAQAKLVSVIRGSILDVAVDIRRGSPTFGQHVSVKLTSETGTQILVPAGFAHGFCTLEPDTEVFYKVNSFYAPEHDRGIIWNDPALGIEWPFDAANMTLSERDTRHPTFANQPDLFEYTA